MDITQQIASEWLTLSDAYAAAFALFLSNCRLFSPSACSSLSFSLLSPPTFSCLFSLLLLLPIQLCVSSFPFLKTVY
uniref:Uncharacterized protein n=1 Tax=Globodera rostochiensis TaxID=31243 RepID=A0A914I1I8_GLORO